MRRRSIAWLLPLLAACGDDGSGTTASATTVYTTVAGTSAESSSATDTGSPTSAGSGSAEAGTSTTGAASADGATTTATATATSAGLDCTDPTDCETCWQCAVTQGPCAAGYDACLANANCVPTLVCIESMCTPGALGQECLDTCCMSCTNLMTCGMVDPTVQCVANACAAVCSPATCP